jgi:hypothetical protein
MRNFVKFHWISPPRFRILVFVCQVFVKRKTGIRLDEYFRHHWERHVVFTPTELLDLWIGAWFSLPEIIGGNANDYKPLVLVRKVELLKTGILGRVSTAACNINDHQDLTFEIA